MHCQSQAVCKQCLTLMEMKRQLSLHNREIFVNLYITNHVLTF